MADICTVVTRNGLNVDFIIARHHALPAEQDILPFLYVRSSNDGIVSLLYVITLFDALVGVSIILLF